MSNFEKISSLLGDKAEYLLDHKSTTISKDSLHLPSSDFVSENFMESDRNPQVIRSLQQLYSSGNLGGSGYLSILPVDQGIEHSAAASFAPNPLYFDPENIVKLAVEAGCNGVASTFDVLGSVARKYAHKIPFIAKINHNETLSLPSTYDQTMYGSVERAWDMGCVAVGATVYFGHPDSTRMMQEVSMAFERAHELGMATILWCYTRNDAFKKDGVDYHTSADLTGQANHLGVTLGADIIKQKLPTNNGGYTAIKFGHTNPKVYSDLTTDHPIDLARYQLANCYMGKRGLISSGGAAGGNDLADAVETAVINKRAGGSGLILGRKAFQKPFAEGVEIIKAVQSVYSESKVDIA